jgi:hypothetical protein
MPRRSKKASIAAAGHLAIGMALGIFFALVLLFRSDASIVRMILDDSSPALGLALYFGIFAMSFGLCATLTGIVLEATNEQ